MRTESSHHVIIAGGGFAAVEALLALRALAQERLTIELIAPDEFLRYRPSATGEPFGADEVTAFPLDDLAARSSATFRRDAIRSVLPAARCRAASPVTRWSCSTAASSPRTAWWPCPSSRARASTGSPATGTASSPPTPTAG